jgi:ribosomal protein L18
MIQDSHKYNMPKYRMVVHIANRDTICQLPYACMKGKMIVFSVHPPEIPKYEVKGGQIHCNILHWLTAGLKAS